MTDAQYRFDLECFFGGQVRRIGRQPAQICDVVHYEETKKERYASLRARVEPSDNDRAP